MPTEKLSATVDAELLAAVRSRVGPRGLSAFVDEAMRHQLRRIQFREYLADLDAELGPVDLLEVDREVEAIQRQLEQSLRPRSRRRSSRG